MENSNHSQSEDERRRRDRHYSKFVKILEKVPIFRDLTIDQLHKIIGICGKNIITQGDYLFHKGDDSLEMFVLIKGELKVQLPDGKELTRIKPVGIVGEMGMFTGDSRSASVLASTDCIALSFNKSKLFSLMNKDCFLSIHILMSVIDDLSQKLKANNVIIEELRQIVLPGEFSKILSKTLMEED